MTFGCSKPNVGVPLLIIIIHLSNVIDDIKIRRLCITPELYD
jgi:hypothetical protein